MINMVIMYLIDMQPKISITCAGFHGDSSIWPPQDQVGTLTFLDFMHNSFK